VTILI